MDNQTKDQGNIFDEFANDDALNEFGLSTEVILFLKTKMMSFISDMLKDKASYSEEEKRILNIQDKVFKDIGNLLVQNIYGFRSYLLTITGFSLAIIGALFTVFATNEENIFTCLYLIYIGLGMLGFSVILSLMYLLIKLTIENRRLSEYFKYQKSAVRTLHDKLIELAEQNKPFSEYEIARRPLQEESRKYEKDFIEANEKKSKIKDWTPHVVVGLFLVGLLLISIGLFVK